MMDAVDLPPRKRIAYWARHKPFHFGLVLFGFACGVYDLWYLWPW
jgi:hypothetical protein